MLFNSKRKSGAEQRRRVWLHIGHGKTGTTALQKYFLDRGSQDSAFHYPRTGLRESGAHHDVFPLEVHRGLLNRAPKLQKALRKEIDKRDPNDVTVLSSEHLCYFRGWQVKQLLQVLEGLDVQILYYVRRQDALIESTYKWLLVGERDKHDGIENFVKSQPQAFDFVKRLEPWLAHVDPDAIHCRLYHRETCGNDIVSDVEMAMGLPPLDRNDEASQHRESLDSLQVDILRAFDRAHPNSGMREQFLQDLRAAYADHGVHSKKKLMSQQVSADVTARFAETNAAFAKRFLTEEEGRLLLEEQQP